MKPWIAATLAHAKTLGIAAITVFAPLKPVLLTVGVLVFADLGTGIAAAKKCGEKVTSSGLKRTVLKIMIYEGAIGLSFLVHQYLTGDLLPADKILAALIGMTELQSVMENLHIVYGGNVFTVLANKIAATEERQERIPLPHDDHTDGDTR